MQGCSNFDYLHVFVGEDQSGRQISDYNAKHKRDLRFIDMKTSDLNIAKAEARNMHWLLGTNDSREMLTYLFNLPENRYQKALSHRGKYRLYANPKAAKV